MLDYSKLKLTKFEALKGKLNALAVKRLDDSLIASVEITIAYSEAFKQLGHAQNSKHCLDALDQMMREDLINQRPIRAAMFVQKATGMPHPDFFAKLREMGIEVGETEIEMRRFHMRLVSQFWHKG